MVLIGVGVVSLNPVIRKKKVFKYMATVIV